LISATSSADKKTRSKWAGVLTIHYARSERGSTFDDLEDDVSKRRGINLYLQRYRKLRVWPVQDVEDQDDEEGWDTAPDGTHREDQTTSDAAADLQRISDRGAILRALRNAEAKPSDGRLFKKPTVPTRGAKRYGLYNWI
jgi:hypothetical protein